jgi:hypothetical protein
MGQIGGAMTIKKSREFGDGEYGLRVTTFVRKGTVVLTSYEVNEDYGWDITQKLVIGGVSPEAIRILRRGSDAEAMEAIFRRLPWYNSPLRIRQAVLAIIGKEFPALREEHKARMEASRRRRLEAIAPPRDGLEHFVAVVISRLPPRAIKVGGVA